MYVLYVCYFLMKHKEFLEKYNESLEKFSNITKKINGKLMYNKKYLKAEKKSYNNKINTKECSQCIYISVILIDSVYTKKNYYPQVLLISESKSPISRNIRIFFRDRCFRFLGLETAGFHFRKYKKIFLWRNIRKAIL